MTATANRLSGAELGAGGDRLRPDDDLELEHLVINVVA